MGAVIGCAIFLVILTWVAAFWMYNFIQNPAQLQSLGLSIDNAKVLLRIFAVLFFWFLFFGWFALTAVNWYRLVNSTDGGKFGYAMGLIFGMGIVGGAIYGGTVIISMINAIETGDNKPLTDLPVLWMYEMANGNIPVGSPWLRLIAPWIVRFQPQQRIFSTLIGSNQLVSFTLNCGNGQTLQWSINPFMINGHCLFSSKGKYEMTLNYVIREPSWNQKTLSVPAWTINFESQITLSTSAGALQFNDQKTELKWGNAPVRLLFDAESLFTDFWLSEYKINWDLDADGKVDQADQVRFSHTYVDPKLHKITFNLPIQWFADKNYIFYVRVDQWDVPICTLVVDQKDQVTYNLSAQFQDTTTVLSDFVWEVVDVNTNRILSRTPTPKPIADLTLPEASTVFVRLMYETETKKRWSCETDEIVVGAQQYQIFYELSLKWANNKYTRVINTKTWTVSLNGDVLTVKELPAIMRLNIREIRPNPKNPDIRVILNNKPIGGSSTNTFDFTIMNPNEQELLIVLKDEVGTTVEKPISIVVDQKKIIGDIKVTPGTVGMDPFEVELDASLTKLTDPDDEIVFFTRDFGDGEVSKNLSNGKVSHTYRFDVKNEKGEYFPSVTITTKKNLKETIKLENPILVRRAQRDIKLFSPSHSSQIARVNENVQFSLETNGLVKDIERDFGNQKTQTCQSRECIEVTTRFEEPWTYTIKATVRYEDHPTLHQTMKIRVD